MIGAIDAMRQGYMSGERGRSPFRRLGREVCLACALALAGCASSPLSSSHAAPTLKDPTLRQPAPALPAEAPPETAPLATVAIRIDSTVRHQVMEGFGATGNEWFDLKTGEDMM